jgi:AraC family transcriptional regulator
MSAVGRAIWFIESHFESDISLEEISEAAGLSRYHLSRVFGLVTGHSISGYIRGRRLSRAVPTLVGGSSTILEVALCAGYGSHEAFTRAFRDQFGMTPDAVRRQGHARNLVLLEPIRMDPAHLNDLEPPRFETLQPMLFAGLQEIYPYGGNAAIPSLWQKFNAHFGHISGQKGNVAYGIARISTAKRRNSAIWPRSKSPMPTICREILQRSSFQASATSSLPIAATSPAFRRR